MTGRTPLLNVVVALLIVGGVLILISWAGPAQNIQTALLAAALAILHFAAALGIALRRSWGRIVGLVIG
ncbi:MAG TPA: hypothetical protein VJ975_11015 [Candidatus Limnocylindria bacterium]|nr:hypothetical protein [Candidatus Limnocylindria bacterium]